MKTEKLTTNQSFGSTKLFTATIQRYSEKTGKLIPLDIFVSKLDHSDLIKFEDNLENWTNNTIFGTNIINAIEHQRFNISLLKKNYIYGIEIPNDNKLIALASATYDRIKKHLYINHIQTNNSCIPYKTKGAGSCLIGTLIDLAKKTNSQELLLESTDNSNGFYKKLNMTKKNFCKFYIPKEQYESFFKTLQNKYSIQEYSRPRTFLDYLLRRK